MKIIFMGTPDFGVPSLIRLIDSSLHEVVAVFTQMPKPKDRGHIVSESPISKVAKSYNIPIFTPKSLRNLEVQELLASIEADLIIVVAYGFIIPEEILVLKKFGCINIHPSLLPRHRGAAPLQRTIIEGDKESGVCIIQMDKGLDTGDIILSKSFAIDDKITLPQLHDKCADLGGSLLLQVLDNITASKKIQQASSGITYASKLSKEESKIDWSKSAFSINCKIRGMNPWPGVYFEYQGEKIKVLAAEAMDIDHNYQPGLVIDNKLTIACGSGFLRITCLQRAGKKALEAEEFLKGFAFNQGVVL